MKGSSRTKALNDLQKWIRIRKDLYRQMEAQVRHRLGEDTPELDRYHKVYESEFDKRWKISRKEELWEQIERSRVVLLGDFHAMKQSQKAHLRILRQLPSRRKIILAVEFFEAADQGKIDRYLAGKMAERAFLKAIAWQKKWGFPWENYKPLMRWAQKHKVAVHGINRASAKKSAATLKSRDVFAGKFIAELVKKNPDALVVVIYGDLHLAQSHIPAQILRHLGTPFAKSVLRIFQNVEKIYFQLLSRELEMTTDLVRLNRTSFCLVSVPPWVKWQNYLMYLEETYDPGLDVDDEAPLDYTDHVGRYVQILSEELQQKLPLSNLSVYTARDPQFWTLLKSKYEGRKLKWIQSMIADGMSFYLPEVQAAYLARSTVNHAAQLAMLFVHAQISHQEKIFCDLPGDFLRRIWLEGISYFGSKLINHKRKTDTIADLKASLASKSPADHGKEAMMLALSQKMRELMLISGRKQGVRRLVARNKWSYMTAARLLGGMMGERLYEGYRRRLVSSQTLMNFLKKPLEGDNFEAAYYEMMEVIESLPAAFQSKKEKL